MPSRALGAGRKPLGGVTNGHCPTVLVPRACCILRCAWEAFLGFLPSTGEIISCLEVKAKVKEEGKIVPRGALPHVPCLGSGARFLLQAGGCPP